MEMTSYKACAVPMCNSNTIKFPNKLFINVPKNSERRKKWLHLARRDPEFISDKSTIFFCEDHFDLPNDMENYIRYSVMGSVGKIRMKPDCSPSRFQCQPDRIKRTAPTQSESAASKKQCLSLMHEIFSDGTQMPATSGNTSNSDCLRVLERDYCYQDKMTQARPDTSNKFVYVCLSAKTRSRYVQTPTQTMDKNTSPIKTHMITTATSPFKIKSRIQSARNTKIRRNLMFTENLEEHTSSSSSPSKNSLKIDISPSLQSIVTMTSTSTENEFAELKKKVEAENSCKMSIENTIRLIKNNPRYYLGISSDCYFIIDIIKKHTNLSEEHILLCLKKIRLNTPFSELGDQFGMTVSYASKIFKKSVILVASVLHPFIIQSNKQLVKRNLPMAFRHKYHNIYCIIDCLEIEIQKPSKSVEQALTWSEYKKANTAKYLISSTPDGIINYISPGYTGRITDVLLVQNCSFLDCLEPGVSILADRGFKHLEELLLQKGINLVRPPSVALNSKLSKQDVIKTKQIASLRIHIERVIRRLREFSLLKPHSVVNIKLLKYLDECTVIACALINLQDSIIKNK